MRTGRTTIMGRGQARISYVFQYIGPTTTCDGCAHFNPCHSNLEASRVYEVRKILRGQLFCRLHEGEGVAVSIREALYKVNLRAGPSVQGALIRFAHIKCDEKTRCPEFNGCHPIGLRDGDLCKIVSIGPSTPCLGGQSLFSAMLSREG